MDNKQAIQGFAEFFKGITGNQNLEIPSEIAEKCGIQALEQSSGDLINRQDAIKAIDEKAKRIKNEDTLNGLAGAVGILFDLPSYNSIKIEPSGDAVSRQAVLKTLDDMDNVLDEDRTIENYKELLKECYEVLPPVKPQEPCEDAISRQAVLELVADYDLSMGQVVKGIHALPSVKPQEPCEDAISRQAVLDLLEDTNNGWIINEVSQLPSVKPQENTGHWIKTPKAVMGEGYMWYCDKCEHQVYQDSSKSYPSEKYCPNCGCRMVEPQEGANE